MSTYTITNNFTAKDGLPIDDPRKYIKGADFGTEFNNIATAINSKANSSQVLTDVPLGAVFTDTAYTKPLQEPISYIDGLEAALDGKVSSTNTDFIKLTEITLSASQINTLLSKINNLENRVLDLEEGGY